MTLLRRRLLPLLAATLAGGLILSGCNGTGASSDAGPATAASDPSSVSGDITVLTNRTDLEQDGTLKKYAAEFEKTYPKVKVTFQAITDYEGEVKIRMNTKNYGDVLLIPGSISISDYPKFFSSLGTSDELSQKYRYTSEATVDGQVYGLAQNGNANGFVYNKKVWKAAGITAYPTTTDEFLADLEKIKATGVTPYYTNYKDGWPLTSWQGAVGSPTCNPDAGNELATDKDPWGSGKDLNVVDSLLYDIVNKKLSEADPTTTNWEQSKTLLGSGKVGTMWLASWAVNQMRDAAKKAGADPADIGLMPFPAQKDGKFCAVTNGDYKQAININSEHKEAARAWLDWFTDKSGYAESQGSIPTLKSGQAPDTLQDYTDNGVELMELSPAPADQVGLVSKIDNASEVGLTKPDYRQALVDLARGAKPGTLDDYFAALDKKWADGISQAG